MRLELRREETRKAALHALIEEIVAYPDALIEVKYRIRNRYRIASKAVEGAPCMYHYVGPNPGNCGLLLSSNMAIHSS